MALGGGLFTAQNKVLPGTYINFVSAARASEAQSDRGYVAVAMELDWGLDAGVMTVEKKELEKDSQAIMGYDYDSSQMKPFREMFLNARTAYVYRLNSGEKASNTFATAKHSGVRGNNLKTVIQENIDDASKFDVSTYLDNIQVDSQTVSSAKELAANDYVTWKADAVLEVTAGMPLAGGTNKAELTGEDYQNALSALEPYAFNVLICTAANEQIKKLYASCTRRLRDECGVKFQTVIHNYAGDYHGIINMKNRVLDEGTAGNELVYWLGGAESGCAINKTLTNAVYDGEYEVEAKATQTELIQSLGAGELCFHKVGDEVRVLEDINSFISFTEEMNEDFSLNQVIRVLDQCGNDIAALFNSRYLGNIQNDDDGRVSFWGDLDSYNKQMQKIRAITNYNPDEVLVEKGEGKRSIIITNPVQPVCAMEKCYMTVYVQ